MCFGQNMTNPICIRLQLLYKEVYWLRSFDLLKMWKKTCIFIARNLFVQLSTVIYNSDTDKLNTACSHLTNSEAVPRYCRYVAAYMDWNVVNYTLDKWVLDFWSFWYTVIMRSWHLAVLLMFDAKTCWQWSLWNGLHHQLYKMFVRN